MYNRLKAIIFLLCAVCAVPSSLLSAADDAPYTYLQGLNAPDYKQVNSAILERGFHIYVRLPENYGQTQQNYPVVYLLDGGATFPILAGYYNYLSLAEDVSDMIVIGISYGANTFEEGNFRSTDFTAPSSERSYWGGASKFQSFLKHELLPAMEATYRIDASRRIIMGQSLGGQFVLYTALTEPDLFWGHITSNPALHRNLAFFRDHPNRTSARKGNLFVSLAENDDDRFKVPANEWVKVWQDKTSTPWSLQIKTQEGHNHFSAITAAFRDGLKWMLPKN